MEKSTIETNLVQTRNRDLQKAAWNAIALSISAHGRSLDVDDMRLTRGKASGINIYRLTKV